MSTAKLTKENAAKLIGTRCAMKSNLHSFLGYAGVYWTEGGSSQSPLTQIIRNGIMRI